MMHPASILLAAGSLGATGVASAQPEIAITHDNIEITESVRIRPGTYAVADADGNGVLHVTGDGVLVDFGGATLLAARGAEPGGGADLSAAEGVGVMISGAGVTVRDANVHGYMYNIRAEGADNLRIEGCDAGRARAQRIATSDGKSIAIWLGLRSLEAWRSYGAGVWLENCDSVHVERTRATGTQNGLLMVGCDDGTVYDCDFSFNSGWGLGLWDSDRNTVAWNLIDFVNRPWGGGWGGDAAGLAVVNGSDENRIACNSLTHGGDGFFLTDLVNGGIDGANRTTNIQGPCNSNVIAYNDGSYSPHNAFEGTFSDGNVYLGNIASHSNYGYWLGFSDNSLLAENIINDCTGEGIAIEQGHGTRIEANIFSDIRGAAIALWSRTDWLGDLHPSRDIDIRRNVFSGCGRDFRLDGSSDVSIGDNVYTDTERSNTDAMRSDREPAGALEAFKASDRFAELERIGAMKPDGFSMLADRAGPKGIEWIQADAFAPRDYRGGLVAWRRIDSSSLELHALQEGRIDIETPPWIRVSHSGQRYTLSAQVAEGAGELRPLTVRIRRDGRSQEIHASFLTARWEVRWYQWNEPRLAYDGAEAWRDLFAAAPIHRQITGDLSQKLWEGGFPEGVPSHHFAIVATTRVKLPAGRYRFTTLSDDGLRVFLDDEEIISRWNHHGPTPDAVEVAVRAGEHDLTVHYCQESGAYALQLGWERVE